MNIIKIKLTNTNRRCLIDEDKLELVNSHASSWYMIRAKEYIIGNSRITDKIIKISHVILPPTETSPQIDHINGDKFDNRLENLRRCCNSENQFNRQITEAKQYTKFKNIYWNKTLKLWQVHVQAFGKRYRGGSFESEIEAAHKANELIKLHHGEFAVFNVFPSAQDKPLETVE